MLINLLAVGRLKRGPACDMVGLYQKRATDTGRAIGLFGFSVTELPEAKHRSGPERMRDEAARIAGGLKKIAPNDGATVALDERGRTWSSRKFAQWIAARRDAGVPHLAFVLGGPDGLDGSFTERADLLLSLGAMTLPHGLARVVLMEQLYRACTILTGHPYHRD